MISQSRLIEQLSSATFKKLVLPFSQQFTQKNYFDTKKEELDVYMKQLNSLNTATRATEITTVFNADLEAKYKDLMTKQDTAGNVNREGTQDLAKAKRIDYDTYLSFNENEIIPAPSVVHGLLEPAARGFKILLYGNKNPESFYKSLLILTTPEFMIKNKYERNVEVLRIKKEVAFAIKKLWSENKYNLLCNGGGARLGFNRDMMTSNLLNRESYVDAPLIQACCDFFGRNIIVFDLVKKSFDLYASGPFDGVLTGGTVGSKRNLDPNTTAKVLLSHPEGVYDNLRLGGTELMGWLKQKKWYMLVLYQGAYLPIFCIDIKHEFAGASILSNMVMNYEWTNPEFYTNSKCKGEKPMATTEEPTPPKKIVNVDKAEIRHDLYKAFMACPSPSQEKNVKPVSAEQLRRELLGEADEPVKSVVTEPTTIVSPVVESITPVKSVQASAIPSPSKHDSAGNGTPSPSKLKGVAAYLLADLQNMATDLGIDVKKANKKGLPTNKTKQELYDEIQAHMAKS